MREVAIRTEKHPKSAVVIWVVVANDEVFVRSWRGTKGRWYRDLAAGGPATLEFASQRLPVHAIPASDSTAVARASRVLFRLVAAEELVGRIAGQNRLRFQARLMAPPITVFMP